MVRNRNYQDMMRDLFPEEHTGKMEIGGNFTRNITIQVTEDCNMACTYCYQHDKTRKSMSVETGKKFIDLILDSDKRTSAYITSKDCPAVILEFIGGEPFLEIDLIDELTDYFIEQCIIRNHPWATRHRLDIISNGLLYFDPKVQEYIRKNHDNLSFAITIDGDKKLHDTCRIDKNGQPTYDRAIAAVEHYEKTYGKKIGTKVTIAPANVTYISESVINMIEHGANKININCCYEEGWKIEHAQILYRQLKTISDYILDNNLENEVYVSILDDFSGVPANREMTWCGGSGLMMAVDPNGDIYPCLRYTPSSIGDKQEKFIIGTVDNGFAITPEEQDKLKCLSCVTFHGQYSGTKCEECQISAGCGDCIAYSYEVTGDVRKRTTFHCDSHKARCLASAYHQNKKYRKRGSSERYPVNTPREWAEEIIGTEEFEMILELAKP